MMITLPTSTSSARPIGHPAGPQHPGAAAPSTGGPNPVFDDIQHALVEARMTTRLSEAGSERLTKGQPYPPGPGMRGRVGRALIGIGTAIAGTGDEQSAQRTS